LTLTTKRYYTMGSMVVAVRDSAGGGSLSYVLGDSLGSTTLSVNAATGAVASQRYLPYGGVRSSSGTQATEKGFIGQTKDNSTGLQYLNARYYDPTIGRFTAVDPLASLSSPGSLDAYGYGHGNPVTMSDPSGLWGLPSYEAMYQSWYSQQSTLACLVNCGGEQLANTVFSGSDTTEVVRALIDTAHEGNLDKLDGNWSQDDIDDAMAGTHLADALAQMGITGSDADGMIALVRDVATRLNQSHDAWEGRDDDIEWHEKGIAGFAARNWRTMSFIAGAGACILASAGACATVVGVGFLARTGATVHTHGLSSGSLRTVGVDAMLSMTTVATAGLTEAGAAPLALGSGEVMATACPSAPGLARSPIAPEGLLTMSEKHHLGITPGHLFGHHGVGQGGTGPLGRGEAERVHREEASRHGAHRPGELGVGVDIVDQTPGRSLGAREALAEHRHLSGASRPQLAHQPGEGLPGEGEVEFHLGD
jgi:RHS repeat-associated protein